MSLSRIVDQPPSGPGPRLTRHPRRRLIGGLALLTAVVTMLGTASSASASASAQAQAAPTSTGHHSAQPDFGPNVKIFDPSMPLDQIQAAVDAVAAQQIGNQFGRQRYALLFTPGTYGTAAHPLNFQVGYYTQVAGLGLTPGDVVINGSVNVYNQCDNGNCIALNNFWRSLENLTIHVNNASLGCHTNEFWAVSQAAP